MKTDLTGRTALVTGASRGIGEQIALDFAAAGADVAITARSADRLNDLAERIVGLGQRAVVIVADVAQEESAERIAAEAVAALGPVTILVNNAGGNSFMSPVHGMRPSGWRKTMNLNLDSIFALTQAVLPQMLAQSSGSVINVSSVAGLRGSPLMSHYGAAKAALISFTQSLALEVAASGIRVNALVPGWIETDLTDFLRADDGTEQGLLARVPMARWGTVQEISAGALFLASDASSFMTGQTLILDGGLSAMP
jgi:NAD(P)-dependent dehydrogenase (short-subunit alcohol dehydrogenase family)